MAQYKQKLNPRTGAFNLVPSTIIVFKASVANYAALPLVGNTIGDARITEDTDHWYSWDGSIWNDQGVFVASNWENINGRPSSAVANIDDAVSKRHTQGTDQGLDTGGANAVTAAQAKAGYTHSGVTGNPHNTQASEIDTTASGVSVQDHIDNTSNPHSVTKTQVGLGNVDDKSESTIITDVKADSDVADAISKKHAAHSDDETATSIGTLINTADSKTTPIDADMVGLMDSGASNILKKLSWANIKATLKTYFDTLYNIFVLKDGSVNPTNLLINGDFENWSSGLASEVVNQSNTGTDSNVLELGDVSDGEYRSGQSFQLSEGSLLVTAVEVKQGAASSGSPSGNWTLRIETDNGNKPSGTLANAGASIVVTPPGVDTIIKGAFATPFLLSPATTYWLVIICDVQATNVYWKLTYNTSGNPYARNIARSNDNGATWYETKVTEQLYFKIYTKSWNPPNGWTLGGASATIARESTIVKLSTYSAKITRAGTNCYLQNNDYLNLAGKSLNYYKGRTFTLGCWVYATVADIARIYLNDGQGGFYSSYHTGNSTWQFLTVTGTMSASAVYVDIECQVTTGDTSAYFDGIICVEGASIFAFADKPINSNQLKRATFVNGDLSTGKLTITHNFGLSAPYTIAVIIFDNNYKQIIPDEITGATNSVEIDLTTYGTLSGTWGYLLLG